MREGEAGEQTLLIVTVEMGWLVATLHPPLLLLCRKRMSSRVSSSLRRLRIARPPVRRHVQRQPQITHMKYQKTRRNCTRLNLKLTWYPHAQFQSPCHHIMMSAYSNGLHCFRLRHRAPSILIGRALTPNTNGKTSIKSLTPPNPNLFLCRRTLEKNDWL